MEFAFPTDPLADSRAPSPRVGLIDIGSNSIRFVVYDQLKRAAVPLYNEKVMCQLGRGLAASGRLNPQGVEQARTTLSRYLALARAMEVSALHVMATAAVRDATDGAAFARDIAFTHGVNVDIISGEREARLGAYGICASVHEPRGLTGDLGGGSLELVHLDGTELHEHATLPIGSLRIVDETKGERGAVQKRIDRALEATPWLRKLKPEAFYAIGGSFRTIGRLHMEEERYPLHILHEYTVPARSFSAFARELAEQSDEKIARMSGVPTKRASSIAPAAMILGRILEETEAERIVFSASGIREGYLYEKLPPYLRTQDVLIASCSEIASRRRGFTHYASELMQWMQPLLAPRENAGEERLRAAFCLLSDIGHHIHPEYRAPWALNRVLSSAFTGVTHTERMALALALYHRYQFKLKSNERALVLLGDRARAWARVVGAAANLAYHLTGSTPGHLLQTQIVIEPKNIALVFSREAQDLMGEAVARRISGLNEAWKEWVG